MRVPFADLKRQTAAMRPELDSALARVLDSGQFLLGNEGEAFESEFAAWLGSGRAAGVANGTDAVELAVRSVGAGIGDEVVTQANTCVPTVTGIERAGASVVLCDVEPGAATMDPESLAAAIGPRTRAVVVVHLYGQCGDVEAIAKVASERNVVLIEDCAQAHGASSAAGRAGTVGALGCFSFYPTKNLGAAGDAGAVVTDDPALDARVRLLRTYGQTDRDHHVERGLNSRLDEVQAAILRAKLPLLDRWTDRRREIAGFYDEALNGTAARPLDRFPHGDHVFHLYVVDVPHRDRFRFELDEAGVETLVHYPVPIHKHPAYEALGSGPVSLRESERLAERVVSLPLYAELNDAEVELVAKKAREAGERQT